VQTSDRSKGTFIQNGFKGGIHICDSPDQVRDIAEQMCGKTFRTPVGSVEGETLYNTGP
jgi:succinyl-CoA synthetase beta subunit